jgi:hypothetical protein
MDNQVSRSGERPEPTVKVRMEENVRCFCQFFGGRNCVFALGAVLIVAKEIIDDPIRIYKSQLAQ